MNYIDEEIIELKKIKWNQEYRDVRGEGTLTLKEYDLFAGVDYKRDTGKLLSYVLNEGIIEYAYSAKKGIYQLTDVQYMQNPNQISFVYGKWGSGGEGKWFLIK